MVPTYEMFLRPCSTLSSSTWRGSASASVACGRYSTTTPSRAMSPTSTLVTPREQVEPGGDLRDRHELLAQFRDRALLAAEPSELLVGAGDGPHHRLQLEVVVGRAGAPSVTV